MLNSNLGSDNEKRWSRDIFKCRVVNDVLYSFLGYEGDNDCDFVSFVVSSFITVGAIKYF